VAAESLGGVDWRIFRYVSLFPGRCERELMQVFGLGREELNACLDRLCSSSLVKSESSGFSFLAKRILKPSNEVLRKGLVRSYNLVYSEGAVFKTKIDCIYEFVCGFGCLKVGDVRDIMGISESELSWVLDALSHKGLVEVRGGLVKCLCAMDFKKPKTSGSFGVFTSYPLEKDGVSVGVRICEDSGEYRYFLDYPVFFQPTQAVLDFIYERSSAQDVGCGNLKRALSDEMSATVEEHLGFIDETGRAYMFCELVNELHLGRLDYLLWDRNIEEVRVQTGMPVYVKHSMVPQEWIETNVIVSDSDLGRYARAIAHETHQQIDSSHPIMDAILHTGDRVNVCLPETAGGKTILGIRVFSKKPWNIVRLVKRGTVSSECLALLWLAIQNRMNILVSGETGCGKTSFVNALCIFIPKNDHVVSVEDTREIQLPASFKNFSHLTTKNYGSFGGVSMEALLVNSLRMNPSLIIMGEVRTKGDILALMNATAMGHPMISTIHTRDCESTIKRFADAGVSCDDMRNIHLNIILESVPSEGSKRVGGKRVREVGEYCVSSKGVKVRKTFAYDFLVGALSRISHPECLLDRVKLKTNMGKAEVLADLEGKRKIIEWVCESNVEDLNILSRIIQYYYMNPAPVLKAASADLDIWAMINGEKNESVAVAQDL
jgi:type IV secretory pathway ATPase VirB11/archaellum biosynthesis ATPase